MPSSSRGGVWPNSLELIMTANVSLEATPLPNARPSDRRSPWLLRSRPSRFPRQGQRRSPRVTMTRQSRTLHVLSGHCPTPSASRQVRSDSHRSLLAPVTPPRNRYPRQSPTPASCRASLEVAGEQPDEVRSGVVGLRQQRSVHEGPGVQIGSEARENPRSGVAHCVDAAKDELRHEPREDRLKVVSYPCRKIAILGSPPILAGDQRDSRLPEDEHDRVRALQDEVMSLLKIRRLL